MTSTAPYTNVATKRLVLGALDTLAIAASNDFEAFCDALQTALDNREEGGYFEYVMADIAKAIGVAYAHSAHRKGIE